MCDAHPEMLRVRLFGFVSYIVDGGDEIRLTDLRFPRVLAYLAVHANAHPTKSAVRTAVWGRVGAEDNLRRAVRELRDQHPRLAPYINDRGRTIGLEPSASLDVDVLTFAGFTRAQRYDEALREVRGGFMADVPDRLSAWVDAERRRWNSQAARVCEVLAARDWHQGNRDSSIELTRHWERLRPRELDPLIARAAYLAAGGDVKEALAALVAFRTGQGTLTQQEARRLDDAIGRLRSEALLDLPRPPVLANGTPASRGIAPGHRERAADRSIPADSQRSCARRPTRRDVHRRVASRADEALREEYRLAGWVLDPAERREIYFGWCDRASRDLMRLTGGAEPKAESLVWTLIAALGEDESFAGYIRRRGGVFLTDDRNWDKLYRAAAATILEEYRAAVEKGTWP